MTVSVNGPLLGLLWRIFSPYTPVFASPGTSYFIVPSDGPRQPFIREKSSTLGESLGH